MFDLLYIIKDIKLKRNKYDDLLKDNERLRERCHRIAEKRDLEYARDMRDLNRLRNYVKEAKERTKDWKADWAFPRDAKAPFQWWTHTSHNHAMEATALIAEKIDSQEKREVMENGLRLLVKELTENDHETLFAHFSGSITNGITKRLSLILDNASGQKNGRE
jgi:hypothetical protein